MNRVRAWALPVGVAAATLTLAPVGLLGWAAWLDRHAVMSAVDGYEADVQAALAQGAYAEAELAVRGALELRPQDPELRRELVRVHALWVAASPERLERAPDVEALRYGLKLLGVRDGVAKDARLWVAAGHLAMRDEGPEAAMKLYAQALERDAECVEAHLAMGAVHRAQGRGAEAITSYERAFAKAPNQLQVLNNLGVQYVDAGRVDDGIKMFERAVAVRDNAASRINLGSALAKAGRAADGLAHFERAVRLAPESAAAARRYGGALLQAGRFAEAARVLAQAVEREPDADGAMTLALAYQGAGDHEAAVAVLRQVLSTSPQAYGAAFLLGTSLEARGEHVGAKAAYERFLRGAPASDPRRAKASEFVAKK